MSVCGGRPKHVVGCFECVGWVARARRAVDAGMRLFMNQPPRLVARFVSECMQFRELLRCFEGAVDLFSSDDES